MYFTLSNLISVYLSDHNMKLKDLEALLHQRGFNVRHTSLVEYKNGQCVPTAEKLKDMLKAMDLPYSDKEVKEIIKNSKEDRRNHAEEDPIWRIGLRIRMKDMYDLSVGEFTTQLSDRVESLKDEGIKNTNQYITYLIKKDLHDNWGIGE